MSDKGRKRRVSRNSKKSYQQLVVSGRGAQIMAKVLACLADKQPLSRRQLSEALNVEICSLCAGLRLLEDAGRIRVAIVQPCKVSKRNVSYYALQSWQPQIF